MLGIKTFIKKNILYPKALFPKNIDNFPERPIFTILIKARLQGVLQGLREQKRYITPDSLIGFPKRQSIDVWRKLLPYNPNNLGNWSIKGIKPNQETAAIEKELILKMIDLYHCNKNKIEGYVSSGGTESNIFLAWLGRKYLEKEGIERERICFVRTDLTHYSIEKATDIVGLKSFITSLDKENWNINVLGFRKTIKALVNKGYRGFLLPLTLGYPLTGTSDSIEDICKEIKILRKEFKKIEFFVWVDAASNGLIEPFLNEDFRPFLFSEIQGFSTDFHKFGFVPMPAGLVLYRNNLRELIEKPVDYLDQKDNTLLGGRSGITPVACWVLVNSLGKAGFRKLILDKRKKMEIFIKENGNKKEIKIISSPNSLNCGIIGKGNAKTLNTIEKELSLKFRQIKIKFFGNDKYLTLKIAKAFFNNY